MSEDWEARMAARARERAAAAAAAEPATASARPMPPDRSTWPVPEEIKGYSGRDVFLWYVMDGWRRILGGEPEVLLDHDFGHHVLSDGLWQLTLTNIEQFPGERFPGHDERALPGPVGEGALSCRDPPPR